MGKAAIAVAAHSHLIADAHLMWRMHLMIFAVWCWVPAPYPGTKPVIYIYAATFYEHAVCFSWELLKVQ